jgi:Protein of unknown function (DUF4058)
MPSPFPGMDLYLEDPFFWHQVHSRLIVALANDLGRRLRPKYYAAIETRTYLEDGAESIFVGIPDAIVFSGTSVVTNSQNTATLPMPTVQPQKVRLVEPIEVKERYLEIRRVGSHEVVAAMEVLSPKNKIEEGRKIYLKKRQTILESASHFVEIDLLRVSQPMPLEGMTGKSDYCILVSAVGDSAQRTLRERPEADLYGFNLQDRIPVFLLPLSNEDSPIPVDLGILLQTVYEEGCFDLQIDYHQSVPEPSLTIQNAEWVKKILQAL